MGLENLKSVFTEDLESLAGDFQSNAALPGESIVVGMSSQFTEGIGGLFNKSTTYASSKFEPMSPLNVPSIEQILTSGNDGGGFPLQKTSYDKLDITNGVGEDINISGIPIRNVDGLGNLISSLTKNRKFPSNTSWSDLYNPNHKSKGTGISYSSNVRSVFSIRDNAPNIRGLSRNPLGLTQGEPYIISNLPSGDIGGLDGGRLQNFGSRSIPITRAVTDTRRISRYLQSESGLLHIFKQNALGLVSTVTSRFRIPSLVGADPYEILVRRPQPHAWGYSGIAQSAATAARLLGTTPNTLFRKDYIPGVPVSTYGDGLKIKVGPAEVTVGAGYKLSDTFTNPSAYSEVKVAGYGAKVRSADSGDKMTIADMINGTKLATNEFGTQALAGRGGVTKNTIAGNNIESEKNGMPFYFKDLRDDTYIFFRAFIDGLTENISPSWASTNYLGRSEPVYVYERSERDISFNLKLFAQTPSELDSIYQKMNRLTSLCYPQYTSDTKMNDKLRMKPPLTKFRLGELFGSENNELTGFIKSISYTYPQESPWETTHGKRVPKYVQASISYQVIHMTVPSLDFAKNKDETFYGTTKHVNGVGVN